MRLVLLLAFSLLLRVSFCIVSLLKVDAFPITIMFGMCSIFLFVAALLQRRLMVIADSQKSTSKFCNLPKIPTVYFWLKKGLKHKLFYVLNMYHSFT